MTWREHRDAPDAGTELCRLEEIPEGGGKELLFGEGKWPFRMFVVRRGDGVRGYVNACPHLHITLNYLPDRFMSHDRERILCANHGAVFNFDDGYCVSGPCAGQTLERVPLCVEEETVRIA